MGLEPHLTPPILYSKHFHICTTDATWSSQGLGQASPTPAHRMHMLADTAGSAQNEVAERSAAGDRRRACTRTTERDPPTQTFGARRRGRPRASLDRPRLHRDRRTQSHDRPRGSLWSTQPTNSIRIEPSLRPSPEADAPSLTRGDFRRLLADGERARNRLWRTGRAGHRAGAGGWFEAVRVGGMGQPEIPPRLVWDGDG